MAPRLTGAAASIAAVLESEENLADMQRVLLRTTSTRLRERHAVRDADAHLIASARQRITDSRANLDRTRLQLSKRSG